MARATRSRGPGDTRRFRIAVAVAFALHLPFAPIPGLDWLRDFLSGGLTDYDDVDASAIVPIDLDLAAKDIEPDPAPAPPPPAEPPPAAPPPTTTGTGEPPPDAGAPRKPPAPTPHETGPKPLVDPSAAAGGAGKIAAKDPNVQVLLSGSVLRKTELGAWGAGLLVQIPEWKGFFEGSPIDPIRDLNHLLITAPRFIGDTSKLVAVMDYNVPPAVAREAVDQVLRRTQGVWIEDAPVTTARARIAGVPRLFAHLPERRMLAVLPVAAMDQLAGLKKAKGFRNGPEGVVVSMVTPSRPFRHWAVIPETLKWARFALTPTPDGGVDLAIDLGDRSHEEAVTHAELLTRELEAHRRIDLGITTIELVDHVTFETDAEGVIRGRTHWSREKLRLLMNLVDSWVRRRLQR